MNKYERLQSVMTVPMDTTVLTHVVVTVLTTLHVTNRLVCVTGDVIRDIPTVTVAKVHLAINIQALRYKHMYISFLLYYSDSSSTYL